MSTWIRRCHWFRHALLVFSFSVLFLMFGTPLSVGTVAAVAEANEPANENVTLVGEYGPCWDEDQSNYVNAGTMAVHDQVAYMACWDNSDFYVEHVSRYAVSSPSSPQRIDNFPSSGGWKEIWFGDGRMVVTVSPYAGSGDIVKVYDYASNPSAPSEIGSHRTQGLEYIRDAFMVGDQVVFFLAREIRVLDLPSGDSTLMTPAGQTPLDYVVSEVKLVDDLAYVVADIGLYVLDLSTPTNPQELGKLALAVKLKELEVASGGWVYATSDKSLHVIDAFNVGNIQEVAVYSAWICSPSAVAVDGIYVFVQCAGLRVFDVSDPATPREVGFYSTFGSGLFVVDGLIYAGNLILAFTPPTPDYPRIELVAEGAGVEVNGEPLAEGERTRLKDKDRIWLRTLNAKLGVELSCEEGATYVTLMLLRSAVLPIEQPGPEFQIFAIIESGIEELCLSASTSRDGFADGEAALDMNLLGGGGNVSLLHPDLEVVYRTPQATMHVDAMSLLNLTYDPEEGVTWVGLLRGNVQIEQVGSPQTPVVLTPNQQVEISADGVGDITSYGGTVMLPLIQSE